MIYLDPPLRPDEDLTAKPSTPRVRGDGRGASPACGGTEGGASPACGRANWSSIPKAWRGRSRELRHDLTPPPIFDPNRALTPSTVRNLSTIMAGAQATHFPVEIDTDARNIVSYAFSLPNGDSLVAFWADNAASELWEPQSNFSF